MIAAASGKEPSSLHSELARLSRKLGFCPIKLASRKNVEPNLREI